MGSIAEYFPSNHLQILDGGLGTTLEDVYGLNFSNTPLWSARAIKEHPDVILRAHLDFLKAGARILMTATYQGAFNTFERAGYTRDEAINMMLKSVKLALDARTIFLAEHQPSSGLASNAKIALSLGPYGATLSPAQEFYGFYPPPYGPQGLVSAGPNRSAWTEDELKQSKRDVAIAALTAFHLERLRIFAEDADAWNAIDILAFETLPLTWEATAVRRAMTQLTTELAAARRAHKPWWIGFVFPDGGLPQRTLSGGPVSAVDAVRAAFEPDEKNSPAPTGIAVNCTRSEFLANLIKEMEGALPVGARPWLVVYPNGGETYDPVTQTWHGGCEHTHGKGWARGVADITRGAVERGCWDGIIVGGCCKTGPAEIAALAQMLE